MERVVHGTVMYEEGRGYWVDQTVLCTCPACLCWASLRHLGGRVTKGQDLCEGWLATLVLLLLSLPKWGRGRRGLVVWFSGSSLGSIPNSTEKEENEVCFPQGDPSRMASSLTP